MTNAKHTTRKRTLFGIDLVFQTQDFFCGANGGRAGGNVWKRGWIIKHNDLVIAGDRVVWNSMMSDAKHPDLRTFSEALAQFDSATEIERAIRIAKSKE